MKLIDTIESHFWMQTSVLYNTEFIASSRPIAQDGCLIPPRGETISAIVAKNPIAILTLTPFVNGLIDLTHLRFIQCNVGINNYNLLTVAAGRGASAPADKYNLHANLFATMGRIKFDLSNYQVSTVAASMINRSPTLVKMEWKIQVFSRE